MHPLVQRILHGDRRAVARAMTLIENQDMDKRELLQSLYPYTGHAQIIGFTGSPGAGKSTLVDQLIRYLRGQGKSIGVLAVDPSSPFTGGALLGDRVRMTAHSADPGVFIRSMGSRGGLGGLGRYSREMLYVLEAYGCDVILLETVGVGQSELDVLTVADTVGLVLTPGTGDHVQTAKAGIMEIADLFVLNKNEFPGSDALFRELQLIVKERLVHRENWMPPVARVSALGGEGIAELWKMLETHFTHLKENGFWQQRRRDRHRDQTLKLVEEYFHQYITERSKQDSEWKRVLEDTTNQDPYTCADKILQKMPWIWV